MGIGSGSGLTAIGGGFRITGTVGRGTGMTCAGAEAAIAISKPPVKVDAPRIRYSPERKLTQVAAICNRYGKAAMSGGTKFRRASTENSRAGV
jgi:hypothetical protein